VSAGSGGLRVRAAPPNLRKTVLGRGVLRHTTLKDEFLPRIGVLQKEVHDRGRIQPSPTIDWPCMSNDNFNQLVLLLAILSLVLGALALGIALSR
jgi:hypothetical protein